MKIREWTCENFTNEEGYITMFGMFKAIILLICIHIWIIFVFSRELKQMMFKNVCSEISKYTRIVSCEKQNGKKMKTIELRRAPGTCCPEPACDYANFDFTVCKSCGAKCDECVRKQKEILKDEK